MTTARTIFTIFFLTTAQPLFGADAEFWDGKIVQYGKMHEAIGKQQHQARVQIKKLTESKHLFAVAALEKLEGEITVRDGEAFVTSVRPDGTLLTEAKESASKAHATMLVGAYVPKWKNVEVREGVSPEKVEDFIRKAASDAGINTTKPFPFVVEGELTDVRIHVINGACPMHARLNKIDLPKEVSPVEIEHKEIRGTLVGIFAKDAVGNLTHPSTSTHTHLVTGGKRGDFVTGHVERVGLAAGAMLRLPLLAPK